MRFSTRIAKIIFIVTALLLLVISTMLYIQVTDLVDANDRVNHTNEVKLRLEEVLSLSKNVETAQRGFFLTKDSLFLQPYASSFEDVNRSMQELQRLTKESKQQQENLEKLDTLVKIRFASFYSSVDSFFNQPTDQARRQMLLREKSLMDSIRRQTNKMGSIETRLLGERLLEKNRHAFLAPVVTVLFIFFSLAVLLVAYYRIIMDLKRSETHVEEMKKLNAELMEKNRQLEITNEELDSFNYISSHDLQEPVRKIRTFISMIEETDYDKLSEKNKYNFRRMQASAIRIQELLHDLLTYSQLNKDILEPKPVDLKKVIDVVKEKLETKISESHANISYASLPSVKGDFFQLQQLFEHLMSNSLKYKQPSIAPHIKIEHEIVPKNNISGNGVLTADTYHKISFIDNGIGFDQEHAHKVFELFAQLHSKEYAGTGIGLTICKKIVQNHNGTIQVKSRINEGTAFEIYLPADHLISQ